MSGGLSCLSPRWGLASADRERCGESGVGVLFIDGKQRKGTRKEGGGYRKVVEYCTYILVTFVCDYIAGAMIEEETGFKNPK
ncbi:hypothetical protein E2562_026289 [Oryza meyeriana var. granulata]|uniref:Uncharacterized protein n=1 Tax=Oryza meyeriana var. granulata TaxID=110450 RepID=A0A6G1C7D2_9ORYZ|nr:hypothetical protein E2562_026289 [Oryza meyeriana var. granulata]